MSRLILVDSGPILHLHEIKRIYLFRIFKERELVVSNIIMNELANYNVSLEGLEEEGLRLTVSHVRRKDIRDIQTSVKDYRLHDGDVSIILLSLKFKPELVMTDDMELRKAIVDNNLKPIGTFGIVMKAWKEGIISKNEVDDIVRDLFEQSTLYLSKGFKKYIIGLLKSTL